MPSFARVLSLLLTSQACWPVAASSKDAGRLVRKGARSVGADGTVHSFTMHSVVSPSARIEEPSNAETMLLELQEMAHSGATPEPDKIRTIKSIVADELLPDLQATHDSAAKQVKVNLGEIDTCNSNGLAKQTEISGTTEVSVNTVRTEHASCREEEKNKHSTKNSKCDELDAFLKAIAVPATIPAGRPRDQMVQYVKTMSNYFCPKGPTCTTLNEECLKASEEHAKHKDACDKLQDSFELGFCTWRTQLTDTCTALSECYQRTLKVYNDHVSDTTDLVKKWKVEYSALKKILCYVEVWLSDNDVKTASADQLSKCEGSSVDTSPMDVDFGTPADQAACPMTAVENYPGTPGFVTTEYAKFKDYVDEVTACVDNVNPTVGPVTTTAAPMGEAKWEIFASECTGTPEATVTLEAGADLSGCNQWSGTDHGRSVAVYIKVSCSGAGIEKEIWFSDAKCTVSSKGAFKVDAANYAKEQRGECFAATCDHCRTPPHMKITGAAGLNFPTCTGAMIEPGAFAETSETKGGNGNMDFQGFFHQLKST